MNNPVMASMAARLPGIKAAMPEWWPVLMGLLVMYAPTFYDLFNGLWATEEQAHGPIILALAIWLIYRLWPRMMEKSEAQSSSVAGWVIFVIALLFYITGRSQQIVLFEVSSFIWVLAAILLIKRGASAV